MTCRPSCAQRPPARASSPSLRVHAGAQDAGDKLSFLGKLAARRSPRPASRPHPWAPALRRPGSKADLPSGLCRAGVRGAPAARREGGGVPDASAAAGAAERALPPTSGRPRPQPGPAPSPAPPRPGPAPGLAPPRPASPGPGDRSQRLPGPACLRSGPVSLEKGSTPGPGAQGRCGLEAAGEAAGARGGRREAQGQTSVASPPRGSSASPGPGAGVSPVETDPERPRSGVGERREPERAALKRREPGPALRPGGLTALVRWPRAPA